MVEVHFLSTYKILSMMQTHRDTLRREIGQREKKIFFKLRKPSISDTVTKIEPKESKSSSRGRGNLRKNGVKAKGRKCFHEIKKSALTEKIKSRSLNL